MADTASHHHLFEVFGVELEYMIVDDATLNVLPVTDRLIEAECGRIESEIEVGDIAWSNELALHVVELKTARPVQTLSGLAESFQQHVADVNRHLAQMSARLMPSAMHPWMDPDREMHLWPHEYSQVYEAFNRIFDCRGHGWANLQSVHLNLPFCGDDEFGRLHAAVRLILPLLPALAAASPMKDGRLTGMLDTRLDVYRGNSRRIPSVCGSVVPEQAFTRADYHRLIFAPMFAEIAPLDPDGVLQDEFLNARGAIARFGRGSVEIRVVDIQECPAADLAVLQATTAALQALVAQRWSTTAEQMAVPAEPLHRILLNAIRSGEQTVIDDESLLKLFGFPGSSARINELWKHLFQECSPQTDSQTRPAAETILSHGPLARRLLTALGPNPDHQQQFDVYRDLTECLAWGKMFV